MTFFPCLSAGKDRIKSRGSRSSPNQRAYRRPSACVPAQHPGRGFWNQERPLGLSSLLLPPRRPAGLLPRPIGCCTPLALRAPICLLYTDHAYFIQFHPDTYTGHANVEETVTAAKLLTKLSERRRILPTRFWCRYFGMQIRVSECDDDSGILHNPFRSTIWNYWHPSSGILNWQWHSFFSANRACT